MDNAQMRFVAGDASSLFSDTAFTGAPAALAGFPAGPVLLRVWVAGVPSAARYTTLAVVPGQPGSPTASGGTGQASVSFTAPLNDGGAPVTGYTATAAPGGAAASCTAPCSSISFDPLPAGSYTFTVTATNAAGSGIASAASNSVAVKGVPTLSWSAPGPIAYGTPLGAAQLNATASYAGNPVAGTFSYTPASGSVLAAGSGQTLSATFEPSDSSLFVAPPAAVTTLIDVTAAATATGVGAPASARVGVALDVSYTVDNSGAGPAVPGGDTVIVTAAPGGASCSASVAAGHCALSFAAAGNYTVTAAYQGSANFAPSSSNPATLGVSLNTTATTLLSAPNPSTPGQAVTVSVTVTDTSGGPVPTGSVAVGADSGETCTASLSAGSGQCTLSLTQPGTRTLGGSYAGDSANAVSSGSTAQLVASPVLAISVSDQNAYARYGAAVEYDVVLGNSGNATAQASVSASTPGTALNLAGASWVCADNGTGSGCSDGSGTFNPSVTLPAGHSMHWILFVPVQAVSADATVELQVGASGNANSVSASDVNTLVLFRYGFELP